MPLDLFCQLPLICRVHPFALKLPPLADRSRCCDPKANPLTDICLFLISETENSEAKIFFEYSSYQKTSDLGVGQFLPSRSRHLLEHPVGDPDNS
jgi:hypothetical protein